MPHTIHLAAIKVPIILFFDNFYIYQLTITHLKLLEGVGAVSSTESKKAASYIGNYQDAATALLGCDPNNNATAQLDSKSDLAISSCTIVLDCSGSILSSVDKVPL